MNKAISKTRTIYFAHGDPKSRSVISSMLTALDHNVALITESGKELIEKSIESPPDLIVAAPRLKDMDGIEAMIRIGEHQPLPGIVIARSDDLEKVERAMEDHVMAYLVEPLTTDTLLPAIYLAEHRFEHFQGLVEKIGKLETRLEERKIVEKAKGIVMQARDLSEPEAHRLLQSTATKNRQKLVELARHVCEAGDILQPKREEASGEGWQKNAP